MTFRIPPTSKYIQMATTGRATGVWERCENTFYFQMPPGITKAYMEFSGIPWTIISLTLIHPNIQEALLIGEIMIMIMRVTDFSWKENFPGATIHDAKHYKSPF